MAILIQVLYFVTTLAIAVTFALFFRSKRPSLAGTHSPDSHIATPTKTQLTHSSTSPRWGEKPHSPNSIGKTILEKRVRNLRKKKKDVEHLLELRNQGQVLDEDQLEKIRRSSVLEDQLREAESELEEEQEERAAQERARERSKQRAKERAQRLLKVKYDENFSCPICQELLEAATLVDGEKPFYFLSQPFYSSLI
jgi:hypothetical protein